MSRKLSEWDLKEMVEDVASRYELDPFLVGAIVYIESGGNPLAMRYESHYRWLVKDAERPLTCTADTEQILQKCSFGLMQMMGAVARERGLKGWMTELFDPELNLEIGCRHLARFFHRYEVMDDAVASYNAGSPRKKDGKYVNQGYVDKVKGKMKELEGKWG